MTGDGINMQKLYLYSLFQRDFAYIYIYLLKRNLPELLIFIQAFANLHGERRQGKFIRKTRICILQTSKYDIAQLISESFFLF